jgi:hypothetical protein
MYRWYYLLKISQKDVLSPDVLSLRTFCPAGRFIPPDVLSHGTFCPSGHFVPRTLCLSDLMSPAVMSPDVLSPDVCPSGHFVSRRFVWAPYKHVYYTLIKEWPSTVQWINSRCYSLKPVLFIKKCLKIEMTRPIFCPSPLPFYIEIPPFIFYNHASLIAKLYSSILLSFHAAS